MKGEGRHIDNPPPPSPEKTTLKKPNLIRVKKLSTFPEKDDFYYFSILFYFFLVTMQVQQF